MDKFKKFCADSEIKVMASGETAAETNHTVVARHKMLRKVALWAVGIAVVGASLTGCGLSHTKVLELKAQLPDKTKDSLELVMTKAFVNDYEENKKEGFEDVKSVNLALMTSYQETIKGLKSAGKDVSLGSLDGEFYYTRDIKNKLSEECLKDTTYETVGRHYGYYGYDEAFKNQFDLSGGNILHNSSDKAGTHCYHYGKYEKTEIIYQKGSIEKLKSKVNNNVVKNNNVVTKVVYKPNQR